MITLEQRAHRKRRSYDNGTSTPWGKAQGGTQFAPGIMSYDTAGHGGFCVSPSRLESMPKPYRDHCTESDSRGNWFEEDCEWAFVALSFPQFFTPSEVEQADSTVKNYFPAAWEAVNGRELTLEESSKKQEDHFYKTHANDFIGCSAWGDWQETVPTGMVGVMAYRGGQYPVIGQPAPETRWFLVPAAEYQNRATRPYGKFVIDESRHQLWEPHT